ncbi:MAG: hypothetical protein ACI8Y4_004169 [Candidatus Poriferisodalaceae bacterium]|jgi:hypothetical protein
MDSTLNGVDGERGNRAKGDGLASMAIMLLTVALIIFVVTRVV